MRTIKVFQLWMLAFLSWTMGCQQEAFKMPALTVPSNLVLTVKVKGQNASNPNGNGSGAVTFTAKSNNAITYQFIAGAEQKMFPSGTYNHTFSKVGTHEYKVTVLAKGAGGATISTSKTLRVLVNYNPPADLLQMLHGADSRTWRIKKSKKGHLGVGPADGNTPTWWSADPDDKSGKGVYDDRITFKKDGTYKYETNGKAFGKKAAMDADFPAVAGLGFGDSGGDYENVPLASFSGVWSLSAPKGQETLSMSGKGYLGMYVGGDHKYQIQKRSANEMSVRTVGADGNAWYMILTTP